MKNLVTNDHARVSSWVASRTGRVEPWVGSPTLGLEDGKGELVGGVVYEGAKVGTRALLHCAGRNRFWLTAEFLFAVFDYAFRVMQLKVLISPVKAGNKDARKFIEHIGFSVAGTVRDGWVDGGDDMVIYQMHRTDCIWLDRLGGRNVLV